jgi:4-diphosphocytidyl-2-C-methyl-D-erythritol kinase
LNELIIQAPAKINLYLAIKSRRADGYHEIETLMQKLELADQLKLRRSAAGISLRCPDSALPEDEKNIAYRAADLFLKKTGVSGGVEIELGKKIPIAAGLGGGSSDAAAVLKAMNIIFAAGLSQEELMEMAYPLGADVPFFVADFSVAGATGIGEKLVPVTGAADWLVVLVNPGFAVSTKWVYNNFALTSRSNPYILGRAIIYEELCENLFNDLESVTIKRYPEIETIKNTLISCGADGVLMSGSGPTVFAVFKDITTARKCADMCGGNKNYAVFLTKPF